MNSQLKILGQVSTALAKPCFISWFEIPNFSIVEYSIQGKLELQLTIYDPNL